MRLATEQSGNETACVLSVAYRGVEIITQATGNGTELFDVEGSDGDEANTPNTDLTFELADSTLPFSIDPDSGVITVDGLLEVRNYDIVVRVSDNGSPALNSTDSFFVEVVPANNYTPDFSPPFAFDITEEVVPFTPVFRFEVTDMDSGQEGTVNLTLLPSGYSSSFRLEFSYELGFTEGRLYLESSFNRESTTNFSLEVLATDVGHELFRRNASQEFSVTVLDVNDNFPAFIGAPYSARVGENATGGFSFFRVEAEDEDIGDNAELRFSLEDGSDFDGTFQIDPVLGDVTVIGTLLRAVQSFYQLTVTVADQLGLPGGLNASTTLDVTVVEVNDNFPVFNDTPATVSITEDTQEGYVLANISVSDVDTGDAGVVDLSLSQTGSVFRLEGDQLVLNQAVDFEVCHRVNGRGYETKGHSEIRTPLY